jgi:hypothetical protein
MRCFFSPHKFYLDDLHRFDDETVVGVCHKCRRAFVATCGLNLPGVLDGRKPAPCPTCSGTGSVPATAK